ncbi:PREDICTED: uncharacterized protein LOC109186401 [Ipomoea nil]|uniref:uncharacterized protein LOC109186401 n=1 Tax=Ipomoea nil TaxID=35883 RepID=UPI000900B95E|nr:PREDICTED: uncharacterized protein LOC109186401 [Ipomoea nil]
MSFKPMEASSGKFRTAIIVLLVGGILGWVYQALNPPPPKLCGSPGGPPITGPRIKLRDGRFLAYKEHGVPKHTAKYKVIFVHGFGSCRHEVSIAASKAAEELRVHFVSFDRQGYGESDPDPNRSIRSTALDIEELGDQLGLGSKFYVLGFSMGGQIVWGCLKYIPHRLAGVGLIAPVVNYWWPGFPASLSAEAYNLQFPEDQWALWVAHHAPWLVYWWNTQTWFPYSSVIAGRANMSRQDKEIISKLLPGKKMNKEYVTQQGLFESLHRDTMVGFGKWEFDPMDISNPFPNGEGSVHLWHGVEDGLVPVTLQCYIAGKLPWIHYHEVPEGGHLFAHAEDMKEVILKTVLTGEK